MDLARIVWRKTLPVYRAALQNSIRSKTNKAIDGAAAPVLSVNEVESKIKDDKISSALCATDELTSFIGLAREFANDGKVEHPYVDNLKRVQMILFDLHNSILRSATGKPRNFESSHIKDLEEWITEYSIQLPPPEDYIIPGGGKACASLHVARSLCRRAERSIEPLVNNNVLDKEAQLFMKKLRDFLLTASRIAAKCDQRAENIYIPRAEVQKNNE